MPLDLLYSLPRGGAGLLYVIASADGRQMNPRGGYDDLKLGERAIGVRVAKVHRDRIIANLDYKTKAAGLRVWQRAVREWCDLKPRPLAHACKDAVVFLLLKAPARDLCPDCGESTRTDRSRKDEQIVRAPRTDRSRSTHDTGNTQREHKEGTPAWAGWDALPLEELLQYEELALGAIAENRVDADGRPDPLGSVNWFGVVDTLAENPDAVLPGLAAWTTDRVREIVSEEAPRAP